MTKEEREQACRDYFGGQLDRRMQMEWVGDDLHVCRRPYKGMCGSIAQPPAHRCETRAGHGGQHYVRYFHLGGLCCENMWAE